MCRKKRTILLHRLKKGVSCYDWITPLSTKKAVKGGVRNNFFNFMTKIDINTIRFRQITLEDALLILSKEELQGEFYTKKFLVKNLGNEMYSKLCRLGFIIESAILNENKIKVVIWKRTKKQIPSIILKKQPSQQQI